MPYHKDFRDNPRLQQPSSAEQLRAVFSFPGLADLSEVLPASCKDPRSAYPDLLLFAVAVARFTFGSQRKSLVHLREPGVWAEACQNFQTLEGAQQSLPSVPPDERTMDRFIARVANKGIPVGGTRQETPIRDLLLDRATRSAAAMAQGLGQFPHVDDPDFSKPNPRNVIFGDGTWYAPFSKVHDVLDTATGELIAIGSRSQTGSPRIQRDHTDGRLDDKNGMGINHVTVSTWSEYGWIVLAVGQALGGEVKEARVLIDRVNDAVRPRGIHTVVWDRAITGLHIGQLMRDRRMLVVNKNVARGKDPAGHRSLRLTKDQAVAMFSAGDPLPLGTTVYETTHDHDMVLSTFHRYDSITWPNCTHDLWVDDDALFDVKIGTNGHHYKTTRATASSCRAIDASLPTTGAAWDLNTLWDLPCPVAGNHQFTTVSRPSDGRGRRSEKSQALARLRPISRADVDVFGQTHGLRNITESLNSWIKARLGTTAGAARAPRLDTNAQLIEHLCVATLANALTFHRYATSQP